MCVAGARVAREWARRGRGSGPWAEGRPTGCRDADNPSAAELCRRRRPAVGTLGRATFRRHQVPEAPAMPRNPGLRCHWPLWGKQRSRPGDSAAPAAARTGALTVPPPPPPPAPRPPPTRDTCETPHSRSPRLSVDHRPDEEDGEAGHRAEAGVGGAEAELQPGRGHGAARARGAAAEEQRRRRVTGAAGPELEPQPQPQPEPQPEPPAPGAPPPTRPPVPPAQRPPRPEAARDTSLTRPPRLGKGRRPLVEEQGLELIPRPQLPSGSLAGLEIRLYPRQLQWLLFKF